MTTSNSKNKPSLLYIAAELPSPPINGYRVRCLNHLKELSKDYNITVVCPISKKTSKSDINLVSDIVYELATFPETSHIKKILNVFSILVNINTPIQVSISYSPMFVNKIREMTRNQNYDIAVLQLMRLGYLLNEIRAKKIIIDLIDSMSHNFSERSKATNNPLLSIIYRKESQLSLKYEQMLYRRADIISYVSEMEYNSSNNQNIIVNPNGVSKDIIFSNRRKESKRVLFWGNLGYFANQMAVAYLNNNLAPLFKTLGIGISVIGPNANNKQSLQNINMTGYVEDLNQELSNCFAAVFPIFYSTGIQNKVLEAIAAGIPLIITENIARPLGLVHENHCLIAKRPEEFYEALKRLQNDTSFAQRLAQCAYTEILPTYSWDHLSENLIKGITEVKSL